MIDDGRVAVIILTSFGVMGRVCEGAMVCVCDLKVIVLLSEKSALGVSCVLSSEH